MKGTNTGNINFRASDLMYSINIMDTLRNGDDDDGVPVFSVA